MSAPAASVLMCAPTAYDVQYEINPWMSVGNRPDAAAAEQQWRALYAALIKDCGAHVELVAQQQDAPDMVFTANAGLAWGSTVLLSRFRHRERATEEAPFRAWFAAQGYSVIEPAEGVYFEGEGDALPAGDGIVAGYRTRTDIRAHHWVSETLSVPVLSVELVTSHWYHLDTAFCPLGGSRALWYPGAFDAYGRAALEANLDLVAVPDDEARRFACNAVVLDQHVVLPADCPATEHALHELGLSTTSVPMSEFIKGGGAAKCLVLHLDGAHETAGRPRP